MRRQREQRAPKARAVALRPPGEEWPTGWLAAALIVSIMAHLLWWLVALEAPVRPPPEPAEEPVEITLVEPPPEPPPVPIAPAPPKPLPPASPPGQATKSARPKASAPPMPSAQDTAPPRDDVRADDGEGGDGSFAGDVSDEPPSPGSVDLFSPGALQKSVRSWSDGRPPAKGRGGTGRRGAPDTPEAEAKRVGGRVDGWLAQAQSAADEADSQAGILNGCDDGIDNNFDGEIDCSDAGCRETATCDTTGVYTENLGLDIPDGDGRLLVRELVAKRPGPLRKLTARVRVAHGDTSELNVTLVAPQGKRVRLHQAEEGSQGYLTVWYVREFIGVEAGGTWRLEIEDVAPGASGRLLGWGLFITN